MLVRVMIAMGMLLVCALSGYAIAIVAWLIGALWFNDPRWHEPFIAPFKAFSLVFFILLGGVFLFWVRNIQEALNGNRRYRALDPRSRYDD